MLYKASQSTGESLRCPRGKVQPAVCLTTKGGLQKHRRQSDGPIVPMKVRSSVYGYKHRREGEKEPYLYGSPPCKAISAKET